VLACAPSNHAVDNLLEKLLAAANSRCGSAPGPHHAELRERAIDILRRNTRMRGKRGRSHATPSRCSVKPTSGRARAATGEKAALRREARDMLSEARKLEALAVERVLDEARLCAHAYGSR